MEELYSAFISSIADCIDGLTFDEAIQHRKSIDIDGMKVLFIALHDFILNKKASGRAQDLADIKEIKRNIENELVLC